MDFKNFSEEQKADVLEELGKWLFVRLGAKKIPVEDVKDVTITALYKLYQNWDELDFEYGINSLKAWVYRTAYHEYLRLVGDEERNKTVPLEGASDKEEDDEESHIPHDKLVLEGFESLPEAPEDEVELVKKIMEMMPSRCQLKMRAGLQLCGSGCNVLSRRYVNEAKKMTIRELSSEFGVRPGTMYDWLETCEDRFHGLWKEQS